MAALVEEEDDQQRCGSVAEKEEKERLERVTFLRLFPQENQRFGFVDEIISEIEREKTKNPKPAGPSASSVKKTSFHCQEVQTDEVIKKEEEGGGEETPHVNLILPLCSFTSFQYNNEAEYASLTGQIANRFQSHLLQNVHPHHPHRFNPQEIPRGSSSATLAVGNDERGREGEDHQMMNESLETQQMRRLGEFVEWRRSLLRDGFT